MKTFFVAVILCVLVLGCATAMRKEPSLHHITQRPRPPVTDLAVNLGLKHLDDLHKLYDALAASGLRCGLSAMSLDAQDIVVEHQDFQSAKTAAIGVIVRDHLTVRIYESAGFREQPATSLLEVWENGHKVRTEEYKLYLSPYTGKHPDI